MSSVWHVADKSNPVQVFVTFNADYLFIVVDRMSNPFSARAPSNVGNVLITVVYQLQSIHVLPKANFHTDMTYLSALVNFNSFQFESFVFVDRVLE